MAKKPEGRTFNVSVIGLSGTEKEKGLYGVGKSCLCNRFIHQVADEYHQEHISVLSQSDFGGRVINNDHFLYWGEVTKTDEGNNFTFHVIEQTEFIDDVSFLPFKTGRTEPYYKRCTQTKVQSAEKLMYICKEQLGMETDSAYQQKVMPDGKLGIDGILCCFDVSRVAERSIEKQVETCVLLLTSALKTKKPVVLVTTKNDDMDGDHVREVEKLLARKEFKSYSIPLVETSAHKNVNIETAFILLAHMMDKSKTRIKPVPFIEAMRARNEILEVAREAFNNLLKAKITDSKTTWASAKKKLEKESDYLHFVDLFGTDEARKIVRQHTKRLREDLIKRREKQFLKNLPEVLSHFLPDLRTIGDRKSWTSCQVQMLQDSDFDEYFVKVCDDGQSWKQTDFVDNTEDGRLPLDILTTKEAEACFHTHVNQLQAARKKEELKKDFWALMERHITMPGGLLSDNYTLFVGKECYTGLQDQERQQVYDEFQRQLKNRLKKDFQELLWERHNVFRSLNLNQTLTEDDLNVIHNSLNDDQRFKKFHKLEDDRKVMLLNHVVFLDKPSVERCYFHNPAPDDYQCPCTECQVAAILRNEQRSVPNGRPVAPPSVTSEPVVRPLNLVLLGMEGLANELNSEIREMCIDDEYRIGHRVYSLDYRIIEGDVTQDGNSIFAPNFNPDGCVCVYNSLESLEYIRSSVYRTIKSNPSVSLPLVVMLAYEPYSMKELNDLRENGKVTASSFQCEFVDIPPDDLAEKLKFYPEQIEQALNSIIPANNSLRIMEDTEPDLRIQLCMMCADPFPMEVPLRPFVHDSSFLVTHDPEIAMDTGEDNMFTVDLVLGGSQQKVEVTVTSYHGAQALFHHGCMYHGFILVFCPKRKASLATLKAFAEMVRSPYMLMVAVPEKNGSTHTLNEHSHGLKESRDVAKTLQARLVQASNKSQVLKQEYYKFLNDVWEHRDDLEESHICVEHSPPPAYDAHYQRPPAPLPHHPPINNKSTSSNSQSTEDSEPLYDQPNIYHQPPSDNERASPSPPPLPSSSPPPVLSETPHIRNDMQLVKPSMLKRNEYAAWAINEPKRQVKSSSLPVTNTRGSRLTESIFEKGADDEEVWTNQNVYSQPTHKPKPFSFEQYAIPHPRPTSGGSSVGEVAPLAQPEKIEISEVYAQVKDVRTEMETNSDYATVDDALPQGKIFRIKSTSRKNDKGTDSEESEFSSLERDRNSGGDLYSKVNRKPTPGKKKQRPKKSVDGSPYISHVHHINDPDKHQGGPVERRSNSPSEDSAETGEDQPLITTLPKKRSIRKKVQSSGSTTNVSDSNLSFGSLDQSKMENEDSSLSAQSTEQLIQKVEQDEVDIDLNESGNKGTWFKKRRDIEKVRKEKEKRIVREEKKIKVQKKIKKKDSKAAGQSESGISLSDFSMSPNNPSVPHFIEKCVEFIEAEGLHAEGIYRIPGNKAQVDLLTQSFNEDPNVDIASLEIQVNAVATFLKTFFAELTDPLVHDTLYDELNAAAARTRHLMDKAVTDKTARVQALRGVFLKMHPLNFEVLKFLITHLHKVSQHSAHNSMPANNLSRCWWPTLFRIEYDSLEKMKTLSHLPEEILETLIEECCFFFHSGNEI